MREALLRLRNRLWGVPIAYYENPAGDEVILVQIRKTPAGRTQAYLRNWFGCWRWHSVMPSNLYPANPPETK